MISPGPTSTAAVLPAPRPAPSFAEQVLEALRKFAQRDETTLLTRHQVCDRLLCGKDFFYARVEPNLIQFFDGEKNSKRRGVVRYTLASVEAYIRNHSFTSDGRNPHQRAMRRRPASRLAAA